MAGNVVNFKICSPLKLHSTLTGKKPLTHHYHRATRYKSSTFLPDPLISSNYKFQRLHFRAHTLYPNLTHRMFLYCAKN